jgi:hypothetical protein
LGLIELAVGFSDARPTTFFYLGRPVGVVLLGLYLITMVFEKESALYDEQNRAAHPEQKPAEDRKHSSPSRQEAAHDPSFRAAHSH